MQSAIQTRQEHDRYGHALINSAWSEKTAIEAIRTLGNQAYQNNISTLVFWNYGSEQVVLRVHRAIRLLQCYGILRSKNGLWYIANTEYQPNFAIADQKVKGIKLGGIVPELSTGQKTCFKCKCELQDHSKARIYKNHGIIRLCCAECRQQMIIDGQKRKKMT